MKRQLTVLCIIALAWTATDVQSPAQEKSSQPSKKDVSPEKQLLETVGALAVSHLYQSYLNIGLMADGKAEGVYDEADIKGILVSVLGVMDTLDKQMDKVAKLELSQEDRDTVEQIRKLSGILRQQADELQAFWKTGDKLRAAKYEKLRKEAWEGISKLLGFSK
jgi:hypothetical protein